MSKEKIKPKILVVEDDGQSLYLVTFLLESENIEVIQSLNGIDGITKAEQYMPDAIILDIQLPDMNGYEVVKELKLNKKLSKIPIIVVSSFGMPGDKNKALEAGADGYIEKPIDPETFVSQIESVILSFSAGK